MASADGRPALARASRRLGRKHDDQVFRVAVRHSQHVRILRIVIPAGIAASLVGALVFTVVEKPLRVLKKVPVDLGSLVVSGSKIMMQQPRLAGVTPDHRRYDLTAQVAGQDVTKPDVVELQGIHATVEMQDKSVFETTAHSGVYDAKSEQLTLSHNIVVTSSTGYQALLSEATIDIRGGRITSEKPLEVKTGTWSVNANRMEVGEAGNVLRFDRGVSVTLLPGPLPRPVAKAITP